MGTPVHTTGGGAAEGEALESGIGTWYKENLKLHYTNTHSLT